MDERIPHIKLSRLSDLLSTSCGVYAGTLIAQP